MRLPTEIGKRLLLNHFRARMTDPSEAHMAVAEFQRISLVADMETALSVTVTWFKPEMRKISEGGSEWTHLQLVYDTVKQDVLGSAVEALIELSSNARSEKERLAASLVLNNLYGDRQMINDEVLTDRLVIDLVGKG